MGVIGLGYVGLPLALEFVRAGFRVFGIDVNKTKIDNLKKKKNYIQDASDDDLIIAIEEKKLVPTNDFSIISKLDAMSICVPTPLNKQKNPDISFINNVISELENFIQPNILIILESTTYPGTTRELILPKLESKGLSVGEDFWLCFSPERIDPGNKYFGTANTPKVLGGITNSCTKHGKALYETIVNEVIPVSSPESAEMVKLAGQKGVYTELIKDDLNTLIERGYKYDAIIAAGVISPGHAQPTSIDLALSLLKQRGILVFSLNDHALRNKSFIEQIETILANESIDILEQEYGDHIIKLDLKAQVYALRIKA